MITNASPAIAPMTDPMGLVRIPSVYTKTSNSRQSGHRSLTNARDAPQAAVSFIRTVVEAVAALVWWWPSDWSRSAKLLVSQPRTRSRYAASLVRSRPSSFTSYPSTLDALDAVNE